MKLRTERDVIEALAGRSFTMDELYAACREAGVHERDNGLDPIVGHGSDQVFKRRCRSILQTMRRTGRAQRVADAAWVIEGTRAAPRRALLVICGEASQLELVLADAAQLLGDLDEPVDLIVADAPWGLGRPSVGDPTDRIEHAYVRDSTKVVPGYVDVPADEYAEFTARWIGAAAEALRPGAYLSVVTGPSGAARVQVAAEDAGLTFVNQLVARRPFAMRTTRRFAHAHTVVTVLCSGSVTSRRRFFATPEDLPKARKGTDYPLDFWEDMPKPAERQGLLRYDNTLPELLVQRLVHSLTPGPENGGEAWQSLVVDPFLGGGTSAFVAHRERRRFVGGDLNPHSLRYVMARMVTDAPYAPVLPGLVGVRGA